MGQLNKYKKFADINDSEEEKTWGDIRGSVNECLQYHEWKMQETSFKNSSDSEIAANYYKEVKCWRLWHMQGSNRSQGKQQ